MVTKDHQGKFEMIIATSSGGPWLKVPGRMGSVKSFDPFLILNFRLLSEEQVTIFSMLNLTNY